TARPPPQLSIPRTVAVAGARRSHPRIDAVRRHWKSAGLDSRAHLLPPLGRVVNPLLRTPFAALHWTSCGSGFVVVHLRLSRSRRDQLFDPRCPHEALLDRSCSLGYFELLRSAHGHHGEPCQLACKARRPDPRPDSEEVF